MFLRKTYMFPDKTTDHSVKDQINYWPSAVRLTLYRAFCGVENTFTSLGKHCYKCQGNGENKTSSVACNNE